jgi:hypothetical protein
LKSLSTLKEASRILKDDEPPVNARLCSQQELKGKKRCPLCGSRELIDMTLEELDSWMEAWTRAARVKDVFALIEEVKLDEAGSKFGCRPGQG